MLLWWNFDGSSVDDVSSNDNNGTVTTAYGGTPQYMNAGREGYYFTNTGCRIDVDLIALSNSWTVCVWINGISIGERQYWMGRHDDSRWNFSYGIYADDRKAAFQFKDSTWGSYAQPSGFQQWDFLTWVLDIDESGTNGYTYMNGELISSKDLNGINNTLHYNALGKGYPFYAPPDSRAFYSFNGFTDDLMIFDKALSSSEVNRVYFNIGTNTTIRTSSLLPIVTNDIAAYYPFDNATKDEINGEFALSSGIVWKNFNRGVYYFDGSSRYIRVPTSYLSINAPFSVSMWFKPEALADETLIGNHLGVYQSYGWIVKIRSAGTIEFGVSPNSTTWSSAIGGSYTADQWNHVVVTFSSTGQKIIYANNSNVSSVNTGYASINIPRDSTYIGDLDSSTQDFTGEMGEVVIYSSDLTSDEVEDLYQAGTNSYFNSNL